MVILSGREAAVFLGQPVSTSTAGKSCGAAHLGRDSMVPPQILPSQGDLKQGSEGKTGRKDEREQRSNYKMCA